jgi:hypothetical protein
LDVPAKENESPRLDAMYKVRKFVIHIISRNSKEQKLTDRRAFHSVKEPDFTHVDEIILSCAAQPFAS